MSLVEIHYTRPPGRTTVFRQALVERTEECIVTLLAHTDVRAPMRVRDTVVLEPDAPVVWFTFPGLWHDIGRFHDGAGGFTGFYANVLTPVDFRSDLEWHTTDLFLDLWVGADGAELRTRYSVAVPGALCAGASPAAVGGAELELDDGAAGVTAMRSPADRKWSPAAITTVASRPSQRGATTV